MFDRNRYLGRAVLFLVLAGAGIAWAIADQPHAPAGKNFTLAGDEELPLGKHRPEN
jgi:hypothetical protein